MPAAAANFALYKQSAALLGIIFSGQVSFLSDCKLVDLTQTQAGFGSLYSFWSIENIKYNKYNNYKYFKYMPLHLLPCIIADKN